MEFFGLARFPSVFLCIKSAMSQMIGQEKSYVGS